MHAGCVALAVALVVFWDQALRAQSQFSFFASIIDEMGRPVETITPDEILVTEDGEPMTVSRIEPVSWPVRVEVLVDNGLGLGSENLIHLRNGLRALFQTLPSGIEASLITTSPQPRFVVRSTTDRLAWLQGVDRIAPDSGAGRFTEALLESATRFYNDRGEKGAYFPVVIMAGTTAGDVNVMERDVQRLLQRFYERAATVHVIMLSGTRSARTIAGANQTQVGIAVTELTGGQYENIAAASRLATLLPELGERVAASHERQRTQFRITVDRPSGGRGPMGTVRMTSRAGLRIHLSRDGHLP